MTGAPALELRGIVRCFGEIEALAGAGLVLERGSVHALLGENGAGKTTLMRIAYGMLRPDAGVVRVDGRAVVLRSPADAIRLGIGMVHQHFTLVPAMTVAENVALVRHRGGVRGWRYDDREAADRVRAIAAELGFALDPAARAGALSASAQQRLEIVKALAAGRGVEIGADRGAASPQRAVLILDEPTAVLAPAEVAELIRVLRRHAELGGAVVIITHKLREALAAADVVTVLRRGRTVLAARAADATESSLADALVGGAVPRAALGAREARAALGVSGESGESGGGAPPRHHDTLAEPLRPDRSDAPVIAQARDVSIAGARGIAAVRGVTLTVRGGEIVALAGVEGAGQRELLRALAGRLAPSAGALTLPRRIGFVPEDRHRDALVLDWSLHENVALRGAGAARGRIRWSAVLARTAELIRRFDVRGASPRVAARALSGGNQQRLVLAREMDADPELLVVENPTRGLDIAATAAVHERLVAARAAGAAVVIYSSDLDEVLALADRVVVMFAGEAREVSADRAAVGRAMLGVA